MPTISQGFRHHPVERGGNGLGVFDDEADYGYGADEHGDEYHIQTLLIHRQAL